MPPRFRLRPGTGSSLSGHRSVIETRRPDGTGQQFSMIEREEYLGSVEEIPEPHSFVAHVWTRILHISGSSRSMQNER